MGSRSISRLAMRSEDGDGGLIVLGESQCDTPRRPKMVAYGALPLLMGKGGRTVIRIVSERHRDISPTVQNLILRLVAEQRPANPDAGRIAR